MGTVRSSLEKWMGCTMIHTSPYHPQGNSRVKRSLRTINNLVRAALASTGMARWPDVMSSVQLTMNSAPRAEHHLSPHELLCGTVALLPVALHFPRKPLTTPPSEIDYVERLHKYL